MKLIVEVQLPRELEDLVSRLSQSLLIQTEAALAFPPAEESTSASAQPAGTSEQSEPKVSKSSKRKKDSSTESTTASDSPTSQPQQSSLAAAVETKQPTLNDVKLTVMAMENGHALATNLLKKMGKGKLSDLSGHELVDFLSQLGVA